MHSSMLIKECRWLKPDRASKACKDMLKSWSSQSVGITKGNEKAHKLVDSDDITMRTS